MKLASGIYTPLVLVAVIMLVPAWARACDDVGDSVAIKNIQGQRDAFNQAIKEKNINAIGAVLHKNVILITGTNSEIIEGQAAQLAIWQGDFNDEQRAVYTRLSQCIRVSPIVPIAMEYGTWRGDKENHTADFAAGRYAAKWRLMAGVWRLESEIFMTEACGGAFCPDPSGGKP